MIAASCHLHWCFAIIQVEPITERNRNRYRFPPYSARTLSICSTTFLHSWSQIFFSYFLIKSKTQAVYHTLHVAGHRPKWMQTRQVQGNPKIITVFDRKNNSWNKSETDDNNFKVSEGERDSLRLFLAAMRKVAAHWSVRQRRIQACAVHLSHYHYTL